MKRIFDGSGWILILVFSVLLSGCKYPAMDGFGWLIPVVSGALAIWSFIGRFILGLGKPEAKGSIFPLIGAIVSLVVCLGYIIYAIVSV